MRSLPRPLHQEQTQNPVAAPPSFARVVGRTWQKVGRSHECAHLQSRRCGTCFLRLLVDAWFDRTWAGGGVSIRQTVVERQPGKGTMRTQAMPGRLQAVAARPLAELLACPADTVSLLQAAATPLNVKADEALFCQGTLSRGLYVLIAGRFLRKAERNGVALTLGTARPGDLLELAAALSGEAHTYSLIAQTVGSVLLLPMEALSQAFQNCPRLRMQLLEELAREVSRAYSTCLSHAAERLRKRAFPARA